MRRTCDTMMVPEGKGGDNMKRLVKTAVLTAMLGGGIIGTAAVIHAVRLLIFGG